MSERTRSDEIIQNPGYCEYLTPVKADAKGIAWRLLLIFTSAVLIFLTLFFTLKVIPAVSFLCTAILVFVTWYAFQFTKIEYEYILATGEFELSKIYGKRIRKTLFRFRMSELLSVEPITNLPKIKASVQEVFYACNKQDDLAQVLVYQTKGQPKKAVVIAAPARSVACLKHYKRQAFTF